MTGNVIKFVRRAGPKVRTVRPRPMRHLRSHSVKGHPKGDEPGRCASGAISNGIRHPHDDEPGNLLLSRPTTEAVDGAPHS